MSNARILTIQDISCVGQCSLTVALPVISAFGTECSILPTAVLSTHTAGFSGYTCKDLTDEIPAILQHWVKEKIDFDLIYTGYLCGATQIDLVKDIVLKTKTKNGLFVVDPVMADHGKFYPGFDVEFALKMKNLCSLADVIIPNITEASFLVGAEYIAEGYTQDYIEDILDRLLDTGAKSVVLTGVTFDKDKLGIAVKTKGSKTFYYFNDKIPHNFHGTGDVYSSAVVGALSIGRNLEESACIAVDFTVKAMKESYEERYTHWYGVRFEKAIPYLSEIVKGYSGE